jgi:hypothetical protein
MKIKHFMMSNILAIAVIATTNDRSEAVLLGDCLNSVLKDNKSCVLQAGNCADNKCNDNTFNCGNGVPPKKQYNLFAAYGTCRASNPTKGIQYQCPECQWLYCAQATTYTLENCTVPSCTIVTAIPNKCKETITIIIIED